MLWTKPLRVLRSILLAVALLSIGRAALAEEWTVEFINDPQPVENVLPVYHVSFLDAGGKPLHTETITEGGTVSAFELGADAQGRAFAYWYDAETDETPYDFGLPVTRDLVLLPRFAQRVPEPAPDTPAADDYAIEILGTGGQSPLTVADTLPTPVEPEPDPQSVPSMTAEDILALIPATASEPAEAASAPSGQVIIYARVSPDVAYGDTIELVGELSGFAAQAPAVSWQYNAGAGWLDTGDDSLTHSFILDEENFHWTWRLVVMGN